MKPRAHDERRLDVAAFAADGAQLEGAWPLGLLERLRDVVPADAPAPPGEVQWSAHGEQRRPHAVDPQTWLHLRAQASIWMECQRCLQPVVVPLVIERSLRFVRGEDTAARLDAESEDDVLELTQSLDLRELIEDELVLALPLVPRHDHCTPALPAAEPQELAEAKVNPFAALAELKVKPPRH
jgi:uncharacterized protein